MQFVFFFLYIELQHQSRIPWENHKMQLIDLISESLYFVYTSFKSLKLIHRNF